MVDNRKHMRFKLNGLEVTGKMAFATDVKIIDISISGISLKANRRLNIGSDYALKLEGRKTVTLKGTVVWCSLAETRKGRKGEMVPVYAAGMQLKDMSAERLTELQYLIESHNIVEARVEVGTFLHLSAHNLSEY